MGGCVNGESTQDAQPSTPVSIPTGDYSEWTCAQVVQWATSVGFMNPEVFQEQRIEGYVLADLTDEQLKNDLKLRLGDVLRFKKQLAILTGDANPSGNASSNNPSPNPNNITSQNTLSEVSNFTNSQPYGNNIQRAQSSQYQQEGSTTTPNQKSFASQVVEYEQAHRQSSGDRGVGDSEYQPYNPQDLGNSQPNLMLNTSTASPAFASPPYSNHPSERMMGGHSNMISRRDSSQRRVPASKPSRRAGDEYDSVNPQYFDHKIFNHQSNGPPPHDPYRHNPSSQHNPTSSHSKGWGNPHASPHHYNPHPSHQMPHHLKQQQSVPHSLDPTQQQQQEYVPISDAFASSSRPSPMQTHSQHKPERMAMSSAQAGGPPTGPPPSHAQPTQSTSVSKTLSAQHVGPNGERITYKKGMAVECWSSSTSQWKPGKIVDITPDKKLLVQLNHNGKTRTHEPDAMGIRPQWGNLDASSTVNTSVRMSEEEKQIEAFAYHLWCTLDKINETYVTTQTYGRIATFTGKELVKHIKKYMQKEDSSSRSDYSHDRWAIHNYCRRDVRGGVSGKNTKDIQCVEKCQVLLDSNYLCCVFLNPNYDAQFFERAEDAYYQIQEEKKRKFQGMQMPDRLAWNVTTTISVHSATLNAWVTGTITEIKEDLISVTYGPPNQQMRKIIDRFSDDIKSTDRFKAVRNEWTAQSMLQVLSTSRNTWCKGRVEEVIPNQNNTGYNNDILKVVYSVMEEDSGIDPSSMSVSHGDASTKREWSKYVERWSPFLRPISMSGPTSPSPPSSMASPMMMPGSSIGPPSAMREVMTQKPVGISRNDGHGHMIGRSKYGMGHDDMDAMSAAPSVRDDQSDMMDDSVKVGGPNSPWVKGASVKVYSTSNKKWHDGTVLNLLPTLNAVDVRYADRQKVLPINSDQIRLVGLPS